MKHPVLASLIFLLSMPSECFSITAKGLPEWLVPSVIRSLKAVWAEIPNDDSTDRRGTLAIVARQLFTGYKVDVMPSGDVNFSADGEVIAPDVKIISPEIRGYVSSWLAEDTASIPAEVSQIISQVPQNALTWAEEALRECVKSVISSHLPGWDFTLQIYISPGKTSANLSFRPSNNMILAIKPEILSRTIPAMFRTDLEARIIPHLSPLIGLPVEWAALHKKDIEEAAREFLEDRHAVENLQANVTVKFHADKVSGLEAVADSKNIMFSVWVSAYAGIEGKYPEAGAFFGFRPLWRINDRYNFAPEIYTEILFALDDFGFTQRFGGRFELLNNFWAGIEYEMPGDEFFVRLEYIPVKIRRPYARWRYSFRGGKYEGGIGYRIDEHISAEIYYDGNIGLRGIWNL